MDAPEFKLESGNGQVQEHVDMIKSIIAGKPLNEAKQIAESTMVAIMSRMSAYTGQRVAWDDAINSDLSIVPAEWDFAKEYPLDPIPVPVVKG